MPTNVGPEFKKAEAEYRKARTPVDRLKCLREMLRTVPKHKGTEHLQADIKTRMKQVTEDLAGPKKGGARTGPPQAVRPEGAAQIALIGPSNAGKSSLLARLTGSQTDLGPYPYTTKGPTPGMLAFEDVQFQLIDLPPISRDFMEKWYTNALQTGDGALLVVDLNDPECVEEIPAIRNRLDEKRVRLLESWPGISSLPHADKNTNDSENVPDPFRIHLPTLLVANKTDLDPNPEEVAALKELLNLRFPVFSVSSKTGDGLDQIAPFLFHSLGIVRVYTKAPGKPADRGQPYTLRKGGTVLDVAHLVHKDIANSLKYARLWGSGRFQGQQVGPDHPVADQDVIELHQ